MPNERSVWKKAWPILLFGIILCGFLAIYGSKLNYNFFRTNVNILVQTLGRPGTFVVHFVLFGVFMLLLQIRSKTDWRSSGIFTAFIISLFGEMFGWALFFYLFSNPFFDYPRWHAPGAVLSSGTSAAHLTRFIGVWIIFASLILIAFSWYQLYQKRGILVTGGIYSKIRHPQYMGFLGFTLGWLIYWPTLLTIFLWPVLASAYITQAYKEDKFLAERYGNYFRNYCSRTGMFFPKFR